MLPALSVVKNRSILRQVASNAKDADLKGDVVDELAQNFIFSLLRLSLFCPPSYPTCYDGSGATPGGTDFCRQEKTSPFFWISPRGGGFHTIKIPCPEGKQR